ncbi:hypothetical protein ACUW97_000240 [Kocuria rhizophila]|uniref:DUF4229 domain-containing protein n=1 Tax=Kocuria rhizophila (strain ATCC 9341 / DSM 348 / NBRC 103217 / DC2201) TaxID=378753 RepID=B2GHK1_KOCRD|nr:MULTISPECIES: DUF4229 domain-containing protein [Kocuria]HAG63453.1 hypothetical protein [Kocuria sp.]ASE11180.1 hypothetical protein CEP81_05610 [Kocuria rhizophila]MBK4121583.1 DUF4229 domain-containing protein [Kocuria rhizophila]MCC5671543.1 DUF4229 domain-containing protein [Kocuria rhizophila]MCC5674677.1 DUF4229 domain-containing protein [Kocuria rhizophila]
MNFVKYSLLRLGILVVLFLLFMLAGLGLVFSGIAAVLAAFAICYIFFPKLHYAAGQDFHRFISRSPKPANRVALEDQEIEDTYTDAESRKDV